MTPALLIRVSSRPNAESVRSIAAVAWAARGEEEVQTVFVRPANLFGVRMRARIVHCGPPQAALLVFEHSGR